MELFSLVAKLTLDSKEFYKAISEAEKDINNIDVDEPELSLDTGSFDSAIAEANTASVKNPDEPVLGIDDKEFTTGVDNANDATVPEELGDPEIGIEDKEFETGVEDANNATVPDTLGSPTVGLETKEFDDGVANVEQEAEGFEDSMTQIFDGIKNALVISGIVGAITGIYNTIKETVDLTAQTADEIDKGSSRLNISRKKYQEWDHALRQSGSSINDLQKGVVQFNKFIAEHNPGAVVEDIDKLSGETKDDMAQAFARLNIDVKDANGQLKTTEQLMEESLIALADFKGSKEERGLLVTTLFGRGGTSLNALLDEGRDGVEDLLKEADQLGLIMSDEEIDNAVAYGDAVKNLQDELNAIKMAFVEDLMPVLTEAVGWLTEFLQKLNPRLQKNSVYQVFDEIDRKAARASIQVDRSTATAKKLIEDLQNMGDYWTLDEQGRMTWDALAAKALELFPQLSEYIKTDGHYISGNTAEIEKNIDAWARLEKQRLLSTAMAEKEEAVANQLISAYDKAAIAAEKEDDAYGQRAIVMDRMMDLLTRDTTNSNILQFRKEFADKFGELTDENLYSAASWFKETYSPIDAELKEMVSEWQTLINESQGLREEANKMIAEAEQAQADLDKYEKKLSEQMGLTQQEVVKTTDTVDAYIKKLYEIPSDVWTTLHFDEDRGFGRAIGDAYIPYDNFPALLHRGEKVLTAQQARNYDGGGRDYTDLEDRIIAAIRVGMSEATVEAVVTDRELAKGTNRFNGKEIDSGRFRP